MDFDGTTEYLGIVPTEIVHKHQFISSKHKAKSDIWLYEVKIDNSKNLNAILSSFINSIYISPLKTLLASDNEIYAYVSINLRPSLSKETYVLNLTADDVLKLSEIGVDLAYDVVIAL